MLHILNKKLEYGVREIKQIHHFYEVQTFFELFVSKS